MGVAMSGVPPTDKVLAEPSLRRTGSSGRRYVIRQLIFAYSLIVLALATILLALRIETPPATMFSWEKVAYCSPALPLDVRVSLWFHELSPSWWDGVKYAIYPWAALAAWLGLSDSRFFKLAFWSFVLFGLVLVAADVLTLDVLVRHSPIWVPSGPPDSFASLMRSGIVLRWDWDVLAIGLIVYHPILLMTLARVFCVYRRPARTEAPAASTRQPKPG
jgi:hypothetical protein